MHLVGFHRATNFLGITGKKMKLSGFVKIIEQTKLFEGT